MVFRPIIHETCALDVLGGTGPQLLTAGVARAYDSLLARLWDRADAPDAHGCGVIKLHLRAVANFIAVA